MKSLKVSAVVAFMALHCASIPAFAGNAAPLGFELGVATRVDVQRDLGSRARLQDIGPSRVSEGHQLTSDGVGLEIEGLKDIAFVFDKNDKLDAVLMTFPKDSFKETLRMLSGKYKAVDRRVPYVGNAYVKLKQGNSIIELEAPHMSFEMTLCYMTDSIYARWKKKAADDDAAKAKKQASKL